VEFNALHSFYNTTNGNSWVWRNLTDTMVPWNFSVPNVNPCFDHWQGLNCRCELTTCHVTEIVLDHHNLTGFLTSSIGEFTDLQAFILRGNNITGTIPSVIGQLIALEDLDLGYNAFAGGIPSTIGSLTSLKTLNLNYNYYLTSLPDTIYNLTSLQVIELQGNSILGVIPSKISNLVNLQHFDISLNYFFSSLPATIGALTKIKNLLLGANDFTGTIPPNLFNLNLTSLYLSDNLFDGTLPTTPWNLASLVNFQIGVNNLFGPLPPSICGLQNVQILITEKNMFSQSLPACMSELTTLRTIVVDKNSHTGEITQFLDIELVTIGFASNFFHGNFSFSTASSGSPWNHVLYLDLGYNAFSGPLPWTSWQEIFLYQVNYNHFHGNLSSFNYAYGSELLYLVIDANLLTGSIPENFFWNSSHLYFLGVGFNHLTGTIPIQLSKFRDLNQLSVKSNLLTSTIPLELLTLNRLAVLDLTGNQFTGPIPPHLLNEMKFLNELFLASNAFTGKIDDFLIWNRTTECRLTNLDISANFFTGSLPIDFMTSAKLMQSFSASVNCLEGPIPDEICQMTNMVSLALDGLTTATTCRKTIFPSLSYFDGFTVDHYMVGSIPSCLYEMPQLQSLHVSGNGLTGTLPDDIILGKELEEIFISYNFLTGTIPLLFQTTPLLNSVDLSYNKLTGTLSDNYLIGAPLESGLTLEVNRLSGNIPNAIINLTIVNVLNSNMFGCSPGTKEGLPPHDQDYEIYSCGSETVNGILVVWIAVILVMSLLLLLLLIITRRRSLTDNNNANSNSSDRISVYHHYLNIFQQLQMWKNAVRDSHRNIIRLSHYFHQVRVSSLQVTLYCLIVLMPIYFVLSVYASTYQFKYIWFASGLLLQGNLAGYLLFFAFILLLLFIYSRMKTIETVINRNTISISSASDRQAVMMTNKLSDSGYQSSNANDLETRKRFSLISNNPWEVYMIYMFGALLNVSLVCVVDVSYVYIVLNYSSTEITFAAFGLAVFRLFNNNFILWNALPWGRKVIQSFRRRCCLETEQQEEKEGKEEIHLQYSTRDISFLERITLFNNVIIPGIAIAFVLPDCFYNALYAAGNVSSLYNFDACYEYILIDDSKSNVCIGESATVTYTPPFIYSYQCSSKIIINYVDVYVLMFILVGLVLPTMKILVKVLYDSVDERIKSLEQTEKEISSKRILRWKRIKDVLESLLPEALKPFHKEEGIDNDNEEENDALQEEEDTSKASVDDSSFADVENNNSKISVNSPAMSENSSTGRITETKPKKNNRNKNTDLTRPRKSFRQTILEMVSTRKKVVFFNKLHFSIQFHSYFAVLITFGALFPPLAVIACFSIFSFSLFEEIMIGRLLLETKKKGPQYEWYEKQINKECRDIERSNNETLWSILFVSSCLYGYILFDIVGDSEGWESALPFTLVMIVFPVFIFLMSKTWNYYLSRNQSTNNSGGIILEKSITEDHVPSPPIPQSTVEENSDHHRRQSKRMSGPANRTKSRVFSDASTVIWEEGGGRSRFSEIQMVMSKDNPPGVAHAAFTENPMLPQNSDDEK
jgi:Leucine-rich repeat (LRR) protein